MMAANKQGQSLGEYTLLGGLIITFCLIGLQQISQSFLAASEVAAGRLNGNAVAGFNHSNNANDNKLGQDQEALVLDAALPEAVKIIAINPPPTLAEIQTALEAGNYAEVAGGYGELGDATYQLSLLLQKLASKPELSNANNGNLVALANEGLLLANRQYMSAAEINSKATSVNGQHSDEDKDFYRSAQDKADFIAQELGFDHLLTTNDDFNNSNYGKLQTAEHWIAETEKQAQQFASVFQQVQANPPAGLSSSDWQTVQTLAAAIKGNWSLLTTENASKTEVSSKTIGACNDGC